MSNVPTPNQPAGGEPAGEAPRSGLWRYAALVSIAAFATTFSQQKSPMVGGLPTTFLLKDHYGMKKEDVAFFFFWAAFAWSLKPVAGILTDAFPLFGTRRRHYMMIGATMAGVCWGLMGAFSSNYAVLLALSIGMNVSLVFSSTVMGGMMVEAGQAFGAPGRMASLRQIVQSIAQIGAPLLGGYLAGKAYGLTAGLAATPLIALAVVTFFVQKEAPLVAVDLKDDAYVNRPRYKPPLAVVGGLVALAAIAAGVASDEHMRNVGISLLALEGVLVLVLILAISPIQNLVIRRAQGQLSQIFASKTLWLAVLMLFLVHTVPGLYTSLTYQQSDVLKFDSEYIGLLTSIEGGVGIPAAVAYGLVCRRFSLRVLLFGGVGLAGLTTFAYLHYTHDSAPLVHGSTAFFAVLAELALMDLAVRSTPRGCEALGFSLMMSFRNFGIAMSDVLGTQIMDQYGVSFDTMVVVNAATTLLVLAFALLLPREVMNRKEGEAAA